MKLIIKNITKLVICLIIVLCLIITNNNVSATTSKTVWDGESVVDVTNDDGSTVTYWKQSETVKRATSYSYPLQSLRATWVSQFIGSIPYYSTEEKWKSDVKTMLDRCEEYGLNAIVYHIRTHNNACYKTNLAPVATFMAKADFDTFDPITYLIEECHKRSIEFHAWLNPYRVNDSYCAESYPASNPASDESNILSTSSGKILNPGIPAVQDYLVKVCREIVENYDVDAIHFDDYFYISGVDDSATRAIYNTKGLSVDDFRRDAVNSFIRKLSTSIKEYNKLNNKAVQIGISPPGGYQNNSKTGTKYPTSPTYDADGNLTNPIGSNTSCFTSYGNYLYADTLNWINNEWIDYIMPQTYWALNHPSASYAELAKWWSWAVRYKKVNLYTGIGYYMAAGSGSSASYWQVNSNQIRDILLVAQTHEEIGGVCYYSYNYLTSDNTVIKNGMNLIKNDYYQTKIPADVKKYYAGLYDTPDAKNVSFSSNQITWDKGENLRGYLIFKVNQGENLSLDNDLQVVYYGNDNTFTVSDINCTYYISTVNLANEISTPKEVSIFEKSPTKVIEYINNIPAKTSTNYRSYLNQVYNTYLSLSDSDKLKVTNKDKLLKIIDYLSTYDEYIDKINTYCNVNEYSTEQASNIKNSQTASISEINQTTTKGQIIEIYNTYVSKISQIPKASVELKEPKEKAISVIEQTYKDLNKDFYTTDNQNSLLACLVDYRTKINNCNSLTTIENLQQACLNAFNNVPSLEKEYQINYQLIVSGLDEVLVNINNEDYYLFYQDKINDLYNQYLIKIKEEKVLNVINNQANLKETYVNSFDDDLYNYHELYQEYSSITNTLNLYNGNKEGLDELKEETIEKLKNSNTTNEMKQILNDFKTTYNTLETKQENTNKTSGCKSLSVIYYMISFLMVLLIFKKKK